MDNRRSVRPVAAVIRDAAPDLLGLQEVHRRLPWSRMADQPAQIAAQTRLTAIFRPSFSIGVGGYGNACLTRLPVSDVKRHRLPGRAEPRAVLQLDLRREEETARIFITHFGLAADEKIAQAKALAEMVAASPHAAIVLGDLNSQPESEELRVLLETGLRHAVPEDLPTYPSDVPRCRIDYILVTPDWRASDARVVQTLASDHLPLVADLELTDG